MTRELFEKKLRDMQEDVLIMGSMVEKAIQRSMDALKTRDVALSNAVVSDDRRGRRSERHARDVGGISRPATALRRRYWLRHSTWRLLLVSSHHFTDDALGRRGIRCGNRRTDTCAHDC